MFQIFYKRRELLPPRLSFDDLKFLIDIWTEDRLIFSEVVAGRALLMGMKAPPPGSCDTLKSRLDGPPHRMTLPINPRYTIPFTQRASVSVLARREDSNGVACIRNKPIFHYHLIFLISPPLYPFISDTRAWISLFFCDDGGKAGMDAFGFELDFL